MDNNQTGYGVRLETVIANLEIINEKLKKLNGDTDSVDTLLKCLELMSKQLGKEINAVGLAETEVSVADTALPAVKPAVEKEDTRGREFINKDSVNLKAYVEDFIKLYKTLEDLGLYWDDSEEYYTFIGDFEQATKDIANLTTDDAIEFLKEKAPLLTTEVQDYKDIIRDLEFMSDEAKRRIRTINRLGFLFQKLDEGVMDPRNDYNLALADRALQMCLSDALNGEHHKEYLNAFLDEQFVFKVAKELADARPAVKKYGKAVSTKNKQKILELDEEKSISKVFEAIKIPADEFLTFSSTYQEFLKELE